MQFLGIWWAQFTNFVFMSNYNLQFYFYLIFITEYFTACLLLSMEARWGYQTLWNCGIFDSQLPSYCVTNIPRVGDMYSCLIISGKWSTIGQIMDTTKVPRGE